MNKSKNGLRKKYAGVILSGLIVLALIYLIGPCDYFTHGFYSDTVKADKIAAADWGEAISLENGSYELEFVPQKNHFAGFKVYLNNAPNGNKGQLRLTIYNAERKVVEECRVPLALIKDKTYYNVYVDSSLKKAEHYYVSFSAENCDIYPSLQTIDSGYLLSRGGLGNVLIGYAYEEPTFTFQNKVLISMILIAIWGLVCSWFLRKEKYAGSINKAGILLLLTVLLTWNYQYNSMDVQNTYFGEFEHGSEALVSGSILAEQAENVFTDDANNKFFLKRYTDVAGMVYSYNRKFLTDANWENGYSKAESAILVAASPYISKVAKPNHSVHFAGGQKLIIDRVENIGTNTAIFFKENISLNEDKCGKLIDIRFSDASGNMLPEGELTAYVSQFGLHGAIFKWLARWMNEENAIANLNLLCGLLAATVFVLICFLIDRKYSRLMAGCFYLTFLLSPWVVNYARNLYWAEFAWFLPMAVGLYCAWKIENKRARVASYALSFVTIMLKSLFSYEYISVIMVGLIVFLAADFVKSVYAKDKEKALLLGRTVIIIGIMALLGFAVALCIHANVRSEDGIWQGLKLIYKEDILRRTSGADLNSFGEVYEASINASVWEVFCRYFKFSTQIVTGVDANLFPLLCLFPIGVFVWDQKRGELNICHVSLYVICFLGSISWICLAKSHSYIHTHINFIVWYFGFVQMCFYIIADKIFRVWKKPEKGKIDL